MRHEVFVDAGAWIAISIARDQYHQAGSEIYRSLLRRPAALVTSNLVIAEAQIAIRRAGGHRTAMRFLESLRQSSRLVKVYSDRSLEEQAEDLLARYADQEFSLTDAVSFAVMHRRGIAEAFAFDHHFLTAGFTLLPSP